MKVVVAVTLVLVAGKCGRIIQDEHAQAAEVSVGKLAQVVQDTASRLH